MIDPFPGSSIRCQVCCFREAERRFCGLRETHRLVVRGRRATCQTCTRGKQRVAEYSKKVTAPDIVVTRYVTDSHWYSCMMHQLQLLNLTGPRGMRPQLQRRWTKWKENPSWNGDESWPSKLDFLSKFV